MEHPWKLLKKHIRERRSKHISEMKLFAKEEWANMPIETCQTHVEKYVNRLLDLFDDKGGPTMS